MIEFAKHFLSRSDTTHVRQQSALNPFIWLCGFGGAAGVTMAVLVPGFAALGVAIVAIPMLTTLGVGVYFAVKDPDRLQGEHFLTNKHSLGVIQAMSGVVTQPELLIPMLNPNMTATSLSAASAQKRFPASHGAASGEPQSDEKILGSSLTSIANENDSRE